MDIQTQSFTTKYSGRTNALKSPVKICVAFDPDKTTVRPPTTEFSALWDTGATATGISAKVIADCGLKPIGMTEVHTANGIRRADIYLINVVLRNHVGIPMLRVTEADIHGADVLIGMDIISQGDFSITQPDGNTTFSFRLPSVACIDFVAEKKESKPVRNDEEKISRNAPCPCGSGKKYKRCCGR